VRLVGHRGWRRCKGDGLDLRSVKASVPSRTWFPKPFPTDARRYPSPTHRTPASPEILAIPLEGFPFIAALVAVLRRIAPGLLHSGVNQDRFFAELISPRDGIGTARRHLSSLGPDQWGGSIGPSCQNQVEVVSERQPEGT